MKTARVVCLPSTQTHFSESQASFAGRIEAVSVPLVLARLHGQLQAEVQGLELIHLVTCTILVLRVDCTVISIFIR